VLELFTFFGEGGTPLGSANVPVAAPAEGQTAAFEVPFALLASAYRYELAS